MNREQAESLLAQLIFDDLEEPARSQLLEYLKTDPQLNEQLGDMRLTARLLADAVSAGDEPKLDETHKAQLHTQIEREQRRRSVKAVFTRPIGSRIVAYAALIAACVLVVGVLLPGLGSSRKSARSTSTMSNMKALSNGMEYYALQNDGRYPESLGQLVEEGYVPPEALITPYDEKSVPLSFDSLSGEEKRRWAEENSSFTITALGKKKDDAANPNEEIIGYYKIPDSDRYTVAFGDGHVELQSSEEARKYLSAGVPISGSYAYSQINVEANDQKPPGLETTESASDHSEQQARIASARRKLAAKQEQAAGYEVNTAEQPAESAERFAGRGFAASGEFGLLTNQPQAGHFISDLEPAPATAAGVSGAEPSSGLALNSRDATVVNGDQPESDFFASEQMQGSTADVRLYARTGTSSTEQERASELSYGWYMRVPEAAEPSGVIALNETAEARGRALARPNAEQAAGESTIMRGGAAIIVGEQPSSTPVPVATTPAQPVEHLQWKLGLETTGVQEQLQSRPEVSDKDAAVADGSTRSDSLNEKGVAREGVTIADEFVPAEQSVEESADNKNALADRQRMLNDTPAFGASPATVEDAVPARKPRLMPVNPWVMTTDDRLSTFALDVDTASYDIARRYIHDGFLPPRYTVRMEEFVNNFDYNYPATQGDSEAFTVHAEAGPSPFGNNTVLLKIGVRGKVVGRDQAKPANLVFVIDTSGSMDRDDRLPLVRQSLAMVLDQLSPNDLVSIVSYGTQANLLIEAAPASDRQRILDALENLQTGGSTNLLEGVEMGYEVAQRQFITQGVNRVILNSDGVANVGPSEADDLVAQAQTLRRQGVTFTSIGFGAGNYDDRILEQLANHGDGDYLFVGSLEEAKRVFVDELAATRPVIAFDAKIQVDFDPARVRRYRLIGYENRDIADADFRNDTVDAGEVGSGQSATALYELELFGPTFATADEPDLGAVYVRYRDADTFRVREIESRLTNDLITQRSPSEDERFFLAACAARFAEVLRGSEHVTDPDINLNITQVQGVLATVADRLPMDRAVQELLDMVRRAKGLPRAE